MDISIIRLNNRRPHPSLRTEHRFQVLQAIPNITDCCANYRVDGGISTAIELEIKLVEYAAHIIVSRARVRYAT